MTWKSQTQKEKLLQFLFFFTETKKEKSNWIKNFFFYSKSEKSPKAIFQKYSQF